MTRKKLEYTQTSNGSIRVCFIAPKAYPLFNPTVKKVFGGAEVDLYFLATELAKDENFVVSFITADYGQKQAETIKNVKVIKSLSFKENPLAGAIKVWRAMQRSQADIYLLKTASPGVPLAAFFCLVHHRVFAYRTASIRECDGTYLKEHCFLGRAFAWSLRRAKAVLVQNAIDEENLARTIHVPAMVIPNGHRLTEPSWAKRDIVLWIGRSATVKRPELFIDLAEKMPGKHFTMICQHATGDDRYGELVERAGRVKNLEFIERVGFDEVESYFQRAKVFVNTSESEGFPNTFIQACNFAVPILSLNVNPDDFLYKYNCGVACDSNWEKLVDSLKCMLEESRYMNMGTNARKYVEEHHDITKIVEQYKKLFVQAVENESG